MQERQEKITLTDLIDIDFLQKLQDTFAKTMGVASLIVDDKGPITKPSNFTTFCMGQIRANPLGAKRCNECDIEGGRMALEKGEPVVYTCHAGLTHFAIPIIIKDQHVATILGGQISSENPDEKHFLNLAKELGITDEKKYLKDLKKIKVVSKEKITEAAKLLSLVSNSISEIALKNYELIEHNKRKELLGKIIEKMRRTLDEKEIKTYFVDVVSNYFNADRCLFVDYDPSTKKFLPFELEKLKSPEMKSIVGVDTETAFPEFCEKLKNKKRNIIIKDLDKTLARKNLLSYKALESLRKSDAKSDYGLIVWHKDQIIGILILHFLYYKKILTHGEMEFLRMLRDHAGTAIYQAKLYQKTVEQAEREALLRKITETIRKTLDINETKKTIVKEVGKAFNADRTLLVSFDPETNIALPLDEFSEYKTDDSKSLVGYDFSNPEVSFLSNIYKQKKSLLSQNIEEFIKENHLENSDVEKWLNKYQMKSGLGVPIFYGNKNFGVMTINYAKPTKITDETAEFFQTIADQAGVALYQANLFMKTKQNAERETLIRKITAAIRASLNLEETFNVICTEIAKISGANRVTITEIAPKYRSDIVRGEYKSDDTIKGINNPHPSKEKVFEHITNFVLNKNEPLIVENIEKSDAINTFKDFYNSLNVKSVAIFPIKKGRDSWGILGISYVYEYKTWNEEEINLYETITDQIYIAIKQAELYDKTLLMAKRESLLRNITEKIRSSLNIDETLGYICEETAKLFNVQRSIIVIYPNKNDYMIFEIKKEYKVSTNIMGYSKLTDIKTVAEYWGRGIAANKIMAVDNILKSDAPENVKNTYTEIGVKSMIGTSITGGTDNWGNLILFEYNQYRTWSDEEKDLLKTISQQVYIAINQAEMYENERIMHERELISRNIIEILRSSIDKTIIKKLFVKNIGKFFNADRVFFSHYDSERKIYLPVDKESEYLSNLGEKSFIGYDWSNPDIQERIQPLLEKREIKISDWEEYVSQHPDMNPELKSLYDSYDLKSGYSFPVLYQDKIIGFFCLEFTLKSVNLSEEDIGRIRSICTQAGIALYHAELYLKAQECNFAKEAIVSEFFEKVKNPASSILDTSILLYQNEFERPVQMEYLNNIISSCNQLLELTK